MKFSLLSQGRIFFTCIALLISVLIVPLFRHWLICWGESVSVSQVTKWMLSKGQGKTLGTYHLLLEALDQEGRVEEADTLWEKILTENEAYTPRTFFTSVIAMFERHNNPKRVLQVLDLLNIGRYFVLVVFLCLKYFKALAASCSSNLFACKLLPGKLQAPNLGEAKVPWSWCLKSFLFCKEIALLRYGNNLKKDLFAGFCGHGRIGGQA